MKRLKPIFIKILALGVALAACTANEKKEDATSFSVPVEYYKLDNGLRVVLSEDHTSPIVVVAAYYNIGFRIEPVLPICFKICCSRYLRTFKMFNLINSRNETEVLTTALPDLILRTILKSCLRICCGLFFGLKLIV